MGNLVIEKFFNGKVDDFSYNKLNQLVKYENSTNDKYDYRYDKRGNRVSDIGKKENKNYVYSLENQLVEGTNWKSDKSAYTYNALGIRVRNKQTAHSGQVYDRNYVIDYTTVYGVAPTVQNYILPADISTPADNWQDGSKTGGLDIQSMLANLNDGFNTLRKNGVYVFVYDYLNNILAVNGKTGTAQDAEQSAAKKDPNVCINDLVNHFLGRAVDNSHITGIGDNNHKLQAYAKFGVGIGEAEANDTSVASFANSDIMVLSPGYFQQKHIYTDRGQRMEQKTDTADNQSGNGGNIKLLYVHEDVMGNTRYHAKDNGQSYAELEYDIWGNPTSPNMLLNNDNGVFIFATFTGHIYDTVLDIYFAEARFYDAKNRQWLGSDPMKDGLNWYQYVRSNPATWQDPSGLMSTEDQQRLQDFGRGVLAAVLENLSGQLDITGKMISNFANAFKVNTPEISSFSYYSNSTVPSADIRIFINDLERDSEYLDSFYLGKMVGDLGIMIAGGFVTMSGVAEILAGLGLGAGGTVAAPVSGGASLLAYAPTVAAVVSGVVSIKVGWSIASAATMNFGSDTRMYFENLGCEGSSSVSGPTVSYNGKQVNVYRGGNDFTVKPNEIKIDPKTGLVKTSHGISVDVDPNTVSKFGGAYKIESLPDGLKIIQRGLRAEHFEIVPTNPMSLEQFQNLLNQIVVSLVQ